MSLRDQPRNRYGGIGNYFRTEGVDDQKGFFAISAARPIERDVKEISEDGSERIRCDGGALGPYGFHVWNEETQVCNCGLSTPPEPIMGHHILTMHNIEFVNVVLSALPYGYILYFECFDPAIEEEACRMRHSDCARTLQEVFRLLIEWDCAYTYFNNREVVAVTCHNMVEEFDIPSDIYEWLMSEVPPQKVEKFLLGDPDAQERASGVPDMSDAFDEWVLDKILHSRGLGEVRV